MGWFTFISQKETFFIGGREVIIRYNHEEDLARFKEIIHKACETQKVAAFFPKITFVLKEEKVGETPAYVIPGNTLKRRIIVYLNATHFSQQTIQRQPRELLETIVHELTHLWHDEISKTLQRNAKAQKRLAKLLYTQFKSQPNVKKPFFALRGKLFLLFHDLIAEGIAIYCETQTRGKLPFTEEVWSYLYNDARKRTANIEQDWGQFIILLNSAQPQYLKMDAFEICTRLLNDLKYQVGMHMVHTILYFDHNLQLEDLTQMKPFKFIREYETTMKNKRVVSMTNQIHHLNGRMRLLRHVHI